MLTTTDYLKTKFPDAILDAHAHHGDETVLVERSKLLELLTFAKQDPELSFNFMMDVCGVDYPNETPRFEVVYHLYAFPKNKRLRIKCRVPAEDCWVPSCVDLWKSADWFERETWDMFGIRFEGHPNLKRVLLFEEFEGHPLRKDYPISQRQKIPEPLERP